jgi:hypothetical protein
MTVLLVEDLQQITIEHFFNASGYSARKHAQPPPRCMPAPDQVKPAARV